MKLLAKLHAWLAQTQYIRVGVHLSALQHHSCSLQLKQVGPKKANESSTGLMMVGHLTIDHPINDQELTTTFRDTTFRSYVVLVSSDMEESWDERKSTY